MTDLPVQNILLETVSVLERMSIPYAIMGGFAARVWGVPRPTFDADIAVVVDEDSLQQLFDELEVAGFDVPPEHRTGFLDMLAGFQKASVCRFWDQHVWHTDLFIVKGGLLESAIQRARRVRIGNREVLVMSPEDIVLLKLIAKRRKDLADVEEIFTMCDLDFAYLRQWAHTLGVNEQLEEFL